MGGIKGGGQSGLRPSRKQTMAIKSALLLALASTASALIISPEPLTHNQAKMFCASQNSRLLDVTSHTRDSVIGELAGKAAWIGSWDYNFYTGECVHFINGHIGGADCEHKLFAVCNSPVVYKSTRDVFEGQAEETAEGDKLGARPRRHHKPCDRVDNCVAPCAPNCGYEYLYLTQTVNKVYTSVEFVTTFTSTVVVPNYTATVAAYVATPNS